MYALRAVLHLSLIMLSDEWPLQHVNDGKLGPRSATFVLHSRLLASCDQSAVTFADCDIRIDLSVCSRTECFSRGKDNGMESSPEFSPHNLLSYSLDRIHETMSC